MAVILASEVLNRVSVALYDTNNVNWSAAELLRYLNDGQRVILALQPTSAAEQIALLALIPGARQHLPVDGWLLVDVLRNMGPLGTTPGRTIRAISRRLLDTFNPNWMTGPRSAVVQSYYYDLRDQTGFFVYPPSIGGNFVEINYSADPVPITLPTQVLPIFPVNVEPLFNYMMFRACSKMAPYSPGPQVASGYWTLMNALLSDRDKGQALSSGNMDLVPPAPPLEGET